jgi:hypothetical protein
MWIDVFMVLATIPSLFVTLIRRSALVLKYPIWFYAVPFLILALISILNAKANFGQPLTTGIFTESRLFYPISIVGFFVLFPKQFVSERSLFLLAMALLATYTVFHFGIRSGTFTITNELMVGYDVLRGGERVKLNLALPVVLTAYLLGKKSRTTIEMFFIAATFLVVSVILGGRIHTIAILLPVVTKIFLMLFFFLYEGRVRLMTLFMAIPIGAILVAVLYLSNITSLIFQAIDTLFGGSGTTADTSASARLDQLESGFLLFKEYGLLGIGKLSNQFDGGFSEIIGYFHFEDLGILGVLMIYGFVGVNFYLLPIVALVVNVARSMDMAVFTGTISFGFLYLSTGESMLNSGLYFFMFCFLNHQAYQVRKQRSKRSAGALVN